MEALKRVRKTFTRMLPVFEGISYKERQIWTVFSGASEAEGRLDRWFISAREVSWIKQMNLEPGSELGPMMLGPFQRQLNLPGF